MRTIILVGIVGLISQFIDGAMGMAYGATTASLLLVIGLAPAMASTTTHMAEIGITAVSGFSHYKFGNIDWRALSWLAVPGGIGALVGAVFLSNIDASVAKPFMGGFLFLLGCWILLKFGILRARPVPKKPRPLTGKFLVPLGLAAGFLDAAGGGGWGPLGTSSLIASQRIEPRKAVGTIDTSEFIVTICASVGFLVSLGSKGIHWSWVLAILIGGVVAAPMAAWLVRKLHPRVLGSCVGGVILLTNLQTILKAIGEKQLLPVLFPIVAAGWLIILTKAIIRAHHEKHKHVEAHA